MSSQHAFPIRDLVGQMLMCPYLWGEQAFKEGKTAMDNPYLFGTDNYDDWRDGWYNARAAATVSEILN